MTEPTEQLHDDIRKDKIINEIRFLTEQLKGSEFTTSSCSDSTGNEWRKITIVYDRKNVK